MVPAPHGRGAGAIRVLIPGKPPMGKDRAAAGPFTRITGLVSMTAFLIVLVAGMALDPLGMLRSMNRTVIFVIEPAVVVAAAVTAHRIAPRRPATPV